jgi:hypothetical protein
MPKNLLSAIILVVLFTGIQINSQTVISKYAGEFMAIGIGGRPLGMGGAYVAVANDVTAGYYNPAGLARVNYPEISLMHDAQFGNLLNYDYVGVAIPFDTDMSFGLSIMRLAIDGIPDTRNALIDYSGSGILDSYNRIDYSKITEFSNQDWAFYLTFAKKEADNFYYGANVKIIRRTIAEYSAWGVGFDAGVQYSPVEKLFLGANLQDITTTMVAWSTGRNELISPTAKVGGSYEINFLSGVITPALDLDIRFENRKYASMFHVGPISFDSHVGFEYNFKNLFAVRAGYSDVKQFTIGAGVKLPKLNIDYSFARFSASGDESLGDTHRISIMLTLEEPKFLRTGM